MRASKRKTWERNVAELRAQYRKHQVTVVELNEIHFRLTGAKVVDYWPTTGRAWPTNAPAAVKVTATEACQMANTPW
jgi:TRAP-type C4-dicarboxylate transport system substrate-binding protein